MSTIDTLTREQELELTRLETRCFSVATSTEPCDRGRFEAAVRRIYAIQNLPPPTFVWTEGLAAATLLVSAETGEANGLFRRILAAQLKGERAQAAIAAFAASAGASLGPSNCASLLDDFDARVGYWLGRDLSEEFRSIIIGSWVSPNGPIASSPVSRDLRQHIQHTLDHSVSPLFESASITVLEALRRIMPGCLPLSKWWTVQIGNGAFGMFAGFNSQKPALHRFLASLGVVHRDSMIDKISLAAELTTTGFWFWPGGSVCLCCERPHALRLDQQHRLHCEDQPAMSFRDGFNVYAIHGVELPQYVVERPNEITVAKIEAEQNAEVRRIMTERFGYGRYLSETGAQVIDMDVIAVNTLDESFGSMPRALMVDKQGQRWLVGTDGSTKRVYYMRAPNDANTCAQAHSALAGFDENQIIASS